MAFSLAPTALSQGYRLETHDTVGSTNAMAIERAAAGDPGRLWVVAKRQVSGRGRRGRSWTTPYGNLAATLLVCESNGPAIAATLGFVAGLAVADTLAALAPTEANERIGLKWPNDVLVDGAKLVGIGLESTITTDGRLAVAVGIGVNVLQHPADVPYPAVSLAHLGWKIDAEQLFFALSDAWVEKAGLWNGGRGLDVIRDQWLERAAGLSAPLSVQMDDRTISGTFQTIDEACRLVVRSHDGSLSTVTAGDVYFGAAHSVAMS